MPRHSRSNDRVDRGTRATGLATVVLVWVAGLAAGFYALLGVAARYGCGASNHGLGCGNGGTAVGIALVLGVIVTVTTVTVLIHGRTPARILVLGLIGLVLLGVCVLGTRALLSTV